MKRFNDILTHVLCICLLSWSLASSWSAYGQSGSGSGSGSITDGLPSPGDTSNTEDCSSYERNSPEYQTCIDKVTGKAVDGSSGTDSASDINAEALHQEIFMSIFAILIALCAILFLCPNNVSGVLFSLGGLLLIIAEIVNWSTFTQASDQALQALTDVSKKTVDSQVAAIEDARKQTHEAVVWANRRANFMMAVLIIWIVAIIASFLEGIATVVTWGSYISTCIPGAAAAFLDSGHKKNQGLYAELYKPNKDDLKSFNRVEIEFGNVDQYFMQKEVNSVLSGGTLQSPSLADYQAHAQVQHAMEGGLFFEDVVLDDSPIAVAKTKSIMSKLMEQIFPTAQAGQGEQAIWDILMAAALIIGMIAFYKSWGKAGQLNGWVRAAFIAVMAGIMGWGYSIAVRKASQLEKREAAYQELEVRIMEKLKVPSTPTTVTNTTTSPGDGVTAPTSTSVNTDGGSGLGGCVSGSAPSTFASPGLKSNDCSCAATNSCTTVETPNPQPIKGIDMAGFEGLSTTPQTVTDANNNLSRNRSVGSRFTSTITPALAAKMKKVGEKLKDKYMEMLKQKGEKNPRSFDDLTKEFMTKIKKDMKVMEGKMTPSLMASLGGLGGGNAESDKTKDKLKELGLGEMIKAQGITVPAVGTPTTAGKLFDDDENGSGAGSNKAENLNTADALSAYQTTEQDILKDSGVSIFEQVSARYRRSAFPIFFLKKQGSDAPTETKDVPKKAEAPVKTPAHP